MRDARRAPRSFFAADAATLARRLIGQRLVRISSTGERLAGTIIETEAYLGAPDRASHAYNGRRTPRNEAMYAQAGAAYVYFTYGMHYCMNVVCAREGVAQAVLLRALEPAEGLDAMRRNRGDASMPDAALCSGPARLCRALAIDRRENALDLVESDSLFIELARPRAHPVRALVVCPRVGIASAGDWTMKPLRWYLRGNPHVSVRDRRAEGPDPRSVKPRKRS